MCLEDSEVDTICLTYYLIYNKIGISFSLGLCVGLEERRPH